MLLGVAGAVLCYWLGVGLFGVSDDNWFVSVRRAFPSNPQMAALSTPREQDLPVPVHHGCCHDDRHDRVCT